MELLESTIEQELDSFKTKDVTLSELTLAIQRLQETEETTTAKVRKTNLFLGQLSKQLELPGLFTLPSGKHFVYMDGERARTKSALPEYMTAEEVKPLAQRNLIPQAAMRSLQDLIGAEDPAPNEFRYDDEGNLIPADSTDAQAQRDAEATAAIAPAPAATTSNSSDDAARMTSDPAVDAAADDAARQRPAAGGSALIRFANSGKGGLRNDPDEVEAITELQTFLVNELGLDTGGIDGRYGTKTRAAVRRFQSALTDVVQDGDAGPETIGKISEIRTDMARIQELVNAIGDSNLADSVIPVRFKSGLAQLLERELTQQERTELEQLINKYRVFRQEFPRFQEELFGRANQSLSPTAPDAQTDAPAQSASPRTDTAPSTATPAQQPVSGDSEVRSSASVNADPDNTGNAQDPEAQTFVQNTPLAARQLKTAMRGFGTDENTIFRIMSSIRNQQQWDQLQRDYQRIHRLDLVTDLEDDLNPTDMVRYVWDPLRRVGIQQGTRLQQNTNPSQNQELNRIRANAGLASAIRRGAAQ